MIYTYNIVMQYAIFFTIWRVICRDLSSVQISGRMKVIGKRGRERAGHV